MTEAIGNNDPLGLIETAKAAANSAATQARSAAGGPAAAGKASGTLDMITLSKAARAAADILEEARAATAGKALSLDPGELLDLDAMLARAESGLKDMLQGLGITGDTEITIHVRADGSVEVKGDHPRAAEIEAAINGDPELRNALVGVHVISSAERIGVAMSRAMEAARNDEANAGAYFNWVRGIIDQTRSADHVFSLQGGSLSAGFVDSGGNRFGVGDGVSRAV